MSDQEPIEIQDGYIANQLLVTFHPSVLETAAPQAFAASRAFAFDEPTVRSFQDRLEATASTVGVDLGGAVRQVVRSERNLLAQFEREGLVLRAVPLRRPRDAEAMLYSSFPASGRTATAIAESFVGLGRRPSDAILSGSVLVSTRSGAESRTVRERLLAEDPTVASVEPVPLRRLLQNVPAGALQPVLPWHIGRIRVDAARLAPGFDDGSGVRVAVLDTGIDADHPLLKPAIDQYSYSPPLPGVSSGSRDRIAHGTHVAGTIAAAGSRGDVEGVSRARLHIHKIFDDDVDAAKFYTMNDGQVVVVDEYYVNEVMYLQALAACVDNNYEVVNLSIGGPRIGHSREQQHFRQMVAQGQAVVAAMGNERRDGSPTSWPAAYDGVIAVGALDLNDEVANFSNHGDHICLAAPGVNILATMPTYRGVKMWTGQRNSAGAIVRDKPLHWTVYRDTMNGTSMASPQVAGASALWIAKRGRNLAGLRGQLESTARKLPAMGGITRTPDYGYGCLDVAALLT